MGRAAGSRPLAGLGWFGIVRIGLVQAAIGALVMMATTVLNRLMVVEFGLAAAIPAGLVAWHYAVQLGRPIWGHGSDRGQSRTLWIIAGIAVLAGGMLLATQATLMMDEAGPVPFVLAVLAYTIIGAGVGAAGTSALALLASSVAPQRRAPAAAVTWIMMIAGIVASAFTVGALIEPFTPARLMLVAWGLAGVAIALAIAATFRLERGHHVFAETAKAEAAPDFREAIREILAEPAARRFTIFIFVSMMAYNMQDLILEPFAGQVFGMAPGESTQLGGMLNAGGLLGMIVAGIGGSAFRARMPSDLRVWIVGGCLGSAVGLAGLATAALVGPGWPLVANVFALGFCNGLFTVAAIGAMMGLAGAGERTREGVRMGVWGASQAIAFGFAGLLGAAGRDIALFILGDIGRAYQIVFALEGGLFVLAAILALRVAGTSSRNTSRAAGAAPPNDREMFA
ncbi:BCD family MFS transporter [Erythrobacter sp. HL-111]|uniref:BCD family MFS transporter n=1 Tax=Erythrobacter sp. HL-111 TaxID=1798193 RepID=UPI0006DB42DC|nr:BCD family MFS transporter [Erythrobacter sp. HL-111]KPP93898.1 MAG: chlorophyll transporter PucC [Erythrobacteraceae bacterium HL-111]SDS34838.1 MFS transporter, BCD family, chlorophyll transporter [Erythrobacter sp. HL-111]